MLIRELEFYDRSLLHMEVPMKLKVRQLYLLARACINIHRPISPKTSISCSVSLYLPMTIHHCVLQPVMLYLLVS